MSKPAAARPELEGTELRFRQLFEDAPVSLREEDWSGIKRMLDSLADRGADDLRAYFRDHPDDLCAAYDMPVVHDISREALRTYRADSKADILAVTGSQFSDPEELAAFGEYLEQHSNGLSRY